MESSKQNFKVQLFITILSIGLFAFKIIAYYTTHSLAILSDALESIVNIVAAFIALYALHIAAKPKDGNHPYGHGKAEFISAAIEGSLILAAGMLIFYQTIHSFFNNVPIMDLSTGLVLIFITALINYSAGFLCIFIGKKNRSLALQATGKHLQIDTYTTLSILAGIGIMTITKLYWLDKIIALIAGVFILYNGYKILRKSVGGIMDEVDYEVVEKIVEIINKTPEKEWIDIHNLRVIQYGAQLHIDCHLTLPWYLDIKEAHKSVERLSALIKTELKNGIELFVHTDPCIPESCAICNLLDCPVRVHPFKEKIAWNLNNILSDQKHKLPNLHNFEEGVCKIKK